ncbi:unnamed protein product [Rotaria socialis]
MNQGDLSGIELTASTIVKCQLDNLYLPGIIALNITFDDCRLRYAHFEGASMVTAKFIKSNLFSSTFANVNLTEALFDGNNMQSVNFSGAILARAKIYNSRLEKVDFANADLLGSNLNVDQYIHLVHDKSNISRFPNGSFSVIDSSQLIKDGSAEHMCTTGRTPWNNVIGFHSVSAISIINEQNISIVPINGNCVFKCYHNSRAQQIVDTQRYLLLIDSTQAWYHLSAYFGCFSSNQAARAYVRIDFATEHDVDITDAQIESETDKLPFQFKHLQGPIPSRTREFSISIGADIEKANVMSVDEPYCVIDDVSVFIFKSDLQ